MSFDLNLHAFRLLKEEPFFAAISRNVTKVANRALPTAGVMVDPVTQFFVMHYNPDFFDRLGKTDFSGNELSGDHALARQETEIRAVLKHEFYHLIFNHLTDRLPDKKMTKMWNIAADLAINSEIGTDLPNMACIPGHGPFKDYPSGLSAEQYFDMIKNDEQFNGAQGEGGCPHCNGEGNEQSNDGGEGQESQDNGGGTCPHGFPDSLDDHSMWSRGEGDKVANDIANERLRKMIGEAVQETTKGGRGWGSVSARMRETIIERVSVRTVDWKTVLRYFVKTSVKADKQGSMKKINRRYPYVHAGKKTSRTANIAVSIDQSGSVGDAMLAAFFAQLNKLADIATFTVVPFDDQVFEEKVYTWRKGQKYKAERVLCGGTNFNAPTDYVNQRAFDGHIVLTDMYAPKPKNSKCQRMWMTTEECASHPYFKTTEKVIAIRL